MICPSCDRDVPGLERFCHFCGEYIADMGTADVTPEARERMQSGESAENVLRREGGDSPEGGTVPDGTAGLPDTRTEAEIQTEAKRALDLLGYHVHDLSQGRPTRQPCGIPDLYIQGHDVTAWLEMKKPGGKVSTHQAGFIERELTNGGNVLVAYSATEAVEYVESLRRRSDAA